MESLETGDRLAAETQKTPNRVTLESMLSKIETEEFIRPDCHPTMVLCILKLTNGFVLVGKSAPADPENFKELLGQKFAREDAIRQMWPFEGYALRERMMEEPE